MNAEFEHLRDDVCGTVRHDGSVSLDDFIEPFDDLSSLDRSGIPSTPLRQYILQKNANDVIGTFAIRLDVELDEFIGEEMNAAFSGRIWLWNIPLPR